MGILKSLIEKSRRKAEQEQRDTDDIVVMFEQEYEDFKENTLGLPKSDIYEKAGKIVFYNNIREFVLYADGIDYEMAKKINTSKPIAALWRAFVDTDYLSVDTYEEIDDLFRETFPTAEEDNIICLRTG